MFPQADVLWKEARLTLRGLRRELAFTLFSIVLLALGIGLASAVFTLLWQAIYAQLPVPDAARIFTFRTNVTHNGRSDSDAMNAETFSVPTYRYLADHLEGIGTVARHGEYVNVQIAAESRHLAADFVSGNFFQVLGVKAAIGRTIEDTNDTFSDQRFVAVLAYDFWQQAFGGQISVWNRVLRVNGVPFRVIGVAPPGFRSLISGQGPQIYLPVAAFADVNPGWHGYDDWGLRWLNAFVRLPQGLDRAQAEAKLQPVYRAAVRQELTSEGTQTAEYLKELSHEFLSLVPASQGDHGMLDLWKEPLRILQWMTLAVLLLAAINVAGLTVVRAVKHRREMSIRYAVGATRTAVMRLYFLQTLALSVAGGLLGLLVARWGAKFLVHLARMDRNGGFISRFSGESLWLHGAAVLATALLVPIFPAWQAGRVRLAEGLNDGAQTHSATRSQALARRSLAAAQIALSLVLVIAAGLFAKALHKLVSVPVGFRPEHLTVFSVDPKLSHATPEGTELLCANIARRIGSEPGVQSVSYGTGGPFPEDADSIVVIPGNHVAHDAAKHQSGTRSTIGPNYLATLGIPLVAGREFNERDRAKTANVVILNQAIARQLFGEANAVGQTVALFNGVDPNWLATVVGVVADHHQSWRRSTGSLVYTPAQQATRVTEMTYYVRTRSAALPEQTIRDVVRSEAPSISSYDVATMETRMAEFASGERAMAVLVGAFALLALTIAATGVYGVVAYGASLRTAEFGVRVAVGAQAGHIAWLVLREMLLILASGLVLAVPITYYGLSIVRHQLEGVSFREPLLYAGAVFVLAFCGLAASVMPAVRALRVSVGSALRHG